MGAYRLVRNRFLEGLLVSIVPLSVYVLLDGLHRGQYLWIAILAALISVLIASLFYYRRLVQPLEILRLAIEEIARGQMRDSLPPRRWGELYQLAQMVEKMRSGLSSRLSDAVKEKEQLKAVLEGMVEGVLVTDSDGHIVVANPRLRELFDSWGDVVGRPYWEAFRRAPLSDALSEASETRSAITREIELKGSEAKILQMHARRFPREGEPVGTVAVFHEVTEIRRLEGLRSDFVANVSHELKTPLTAIRGFTETLIAGETSSEQQRQYLEVIERHAGRLTQLINDLLFLSQLEGSRETPDFSEVNIGRLVDNVLEDLMPQFDARNLSIEKKISSDAVIWTERRSVERIISNLLDNAVKYNSPGGSVEVRVLEKSDTVSIQVIDSGLGIPEELQDRIFERFYRLDAARGKDIAGTGLGLAIAKHLVRLCGGEISVESKLGVGSRFTVNLPRRL